MPLAAIHPGAVVVPCADKLPEAEGTNRHRSRAAAFMMRRMPLRPVPALPEVRIHAAGPEAGLGRFIAETGGRAPYWAYPWAGGSALARHLLDRPECVAGRCVLDLGAGSGIVGIAAAKAGARHVLAVDTDPNAAVATELNARANGVTLQVSCSDMTAAADLPPVDLVAAGDLFYQRRLAARVLRFLDRCLAQGIEVLIGDPGRAHLPVARLRLLAEVRVPDFGEPGATREARAAVYALAPIARGGNRSHLGL